MNEDDPDADRQKPSAQAGAGGTEFLLREVARGANDQAWGMLSQKCLHYLKSRFGRSSFPHGVEFGDFVSDVMLRILTSIDSFEYRGKDSFWRWVQTLAGNMWRDQWRRHRRDQRLGLLGRGDDPASEDGAPQSAPEAAPTRDETPTQIVRRRELEDIERDCVDRLSATVRDVYMMRRQHELSFAEISERTGGTNEATLRSHYMRARDRVRECLGAKIDALAGSLRGWQ